MLLLVTSATTAGIATANEAPLPDAGLDQTVTRGATVHLDAGGSRDPDGRITDYDWRVETPNGSTTEPDCGDCERTQFQAASVGEYTVTLTVTDDDGATATDTLYVRVDPGEPPSVSLAGPTQLSPGERDTYTATVDAGAAPLDRLVWYTDGERYATTDIDGSAASADQRLQFPDAGTHDVSVTAVDEDDQRGDATHAVDVTTPTRVAPTEPDSPTDSDDDSAVTTPTPDVQGPRTVTGNTTLDATYSLTNETTADWFLDDHHVDVGRTATLTLSPGRHDLYATPDRGGVSTFPDGTQSILADPAPDVHLERLTEESIVTVDAYATDDLGNLQSLAVLVDGDLQHTTTLGGIRRRSMDGDRLTTLERLTDVPPGTHNVTVRATDSRGQTDSKSRTITVPGPPKVMNARFVNDEPLTSKHPKLDPEDYTGEFEIDIDLNGVDPESVSAELRDPRKEQVSIVPSSDRSTSSPDSLTIRQNYSRVYGGQINANGAVYWVRGNNRQPVDGVSGTTHAELSNPVIQLELVDDQNRIGSRGATFDASESFDPDGSKLTFQWNDLNSSDKWTGPIKQLNPRKLIYLNVTDSQEQSNKTYNILGWFTPGLQTPEAQNLETIFPQDTVTYRVRTSRYELSQAVYEKEKFGKIIDFELVSDVGSIGGYNRYWENENGGSFDQSRPEGFADSYIFHEWFVSLPASEFLSGDEPTVRIQSTSQHESFHEVELPEPKMDNQIGSSVDLWEFDVQYVEERPHYEVERTTRSERKDALQQMGFNLYTARQSGTKYYLKKRVKTQPAKWKTDIRSFDSRFQRQLFVDRNDGWQADGMSEERRERTVTDSVWRNHRGGSGEFTGDTRQIRVEPAEVETLREYEYETEYTVEVTEEKERKSCLPRLGCRTYSIETTTEETRTAEHDYWSSRPRNPTHDWTGATRTRIVERAEYEKQYEYHVEDNELYWEQVYHASMRKKTQPAQYEWQHHETVTTERAASILTMNPNIKQARTEPTCEWTLRRQDGTVSRITDTPEQQSSVVETRMTARAHVEARYLPPDPSLRSDVVVNERIVDVTETAEGYLPTEKANNIIREEANETHAESF
ncbi:PKD domain-containing protein [Halobacterium jilantaiense]|uniref:PKD domain-containing protein n=1 Tax=Halobacterium jilantaiense TaxID=355548 RepID=UPI00115F87FE|nr:PKD domain-containing protein [Halobacterium jilantaiense]